MDSLLIYLTQTLKDKYPQNKFSFKEIRYHFTHVFRIKDRQAREIIQEMISMGLIIYNQIDKKELYSIDFDVESAVILKFNERRLEEFKKSLGLQDE